MSSSESMCSIVVQINAGGFSRSNQPRMSKTAISTTLRSNTGWWPAPESIWRHRAWRTWVEITCLTAALFDARRFFRIRNLTRQVERLQPGLTVQLRSEFRVLAMPEAPNIPAGRQCSDPFTCEFFDHCNPSIPDDHILRLPRIHASTVAKLAALGIQSIHDIPENYPLTGRLRRVRASVQMGEPWYHPEIGKELSKLKYPLYFADFETVNPALPRFAGMRPYDQIPFQWSVHTQRQPGAAPEHFEFLATDRSDPRPAFISALCDALDDRGSIVVYHQQFELQRLSELASWLPEFRGRITKIQRRLWDLLPIVRDHVYHPAFGGSYCLKSVLPALVPEMSYTGLEVADGQAAGLAWESLIGGDCSEVERRRKQKALLDYRGQDPLGMVRLLGFWKDLSEYTDLCSSLIAYPEAVPKERSGGAARWNRSRRKGLLKQAL
jgi:hypothetical protein